ncbi:MAG: RdgB/HAM1 family non-canonical purine NTP pyrophosphatase [Acidobacteria bacterium]|nr:RdgB/HAM1 family non-canonical purine NTP pyrophosphatase [Acidobacteriota bacterium]
MTLLVATTNPGKMREIARLLGPLPLTLASLDQFPRIAEPKETGSTFAENARLKALYYTQATGLASVADDSGLEIDALGGAPGVHSARWEGSDYAVKFKKIYERLDARNARGSAARFVCRVALAESGRVIFESEGCIEGRIADAPRGENGFGYDPIFLYPPLGQTTAELEPDVKATVSHRGKAFAALRAYLESSLQRDLELRTPNSELRTTNRSK